MDLNRIKKGNPYPLGATVLSGGVNFATVVNEKSECGIVLYPKDSTKEEIKIPFDQKKKVGNISCLMIKDLDIDEYEYNFYHDDNIFTDPYAKSISGRKKWGEVQEQKQRGVFYKRSFDWQKTRPLRIPYSDSLIYCLHVRGFTKHESSRAKHKGTFLGIIEKIPYLKDLGITAIELMPSYEFDECALKEKKNQSMEYAVAHLSDQMDKESTKLNYWGYDDAFYFAPKASYAAGEDPCLEMKELVRELHKNGIELIMQFNFTQSCKQGYIVDVLKHWVLEYMVDGFHLKGGRIPITLLATDPLFANTKLMYHDFPLDEIYPGNEVPSYLNLAYYRDEFMYDMRKFLKGDSDMLSSVQFHMKNKPEKASCINFISNYYGFTLYDLVSYDRKHNDQNGENNQDGTDYNYSWNCGFEGETKKKTVLSLRRKQMMNALSFVLLSQGTPLIYSGDEFGNTQLGNNNAYCQDNEISWLNWKHKKLGKDILEFTRQLIALRKAHPVLHREEQMRLMDYIGCGYPDLSYHGNEAWRIGLENYNRHIAMMYCGKYIKVDRRREDDFFYIACNMYWEKQKFALPRLPEQFEWALVFDSVDGFCQMEDVPKYNKELEVTERTVCVLKSVTKKNKRTHTKNRLQKVDCQED